MKVHDTGLPGVRLIEPVVHPDARGFFVEEWNERRYADAGMPNRFVQDNLSMSHRGVVRGLHFQAEPYGQAKLVRVPQGTILDVVVDLRNGSPTFARWEAHELDSRSLRQLFIPAGFAHGFAVLSESALVAYKCDAFHEPSAERTLLWSDPQLAIPWPTADPIISDKDRAGQTLADLFA